MLKSKTKMVQKCFGIIILETRIVKIDMEKPEET